MNNTYPEQYNIIKSVKCPKNANKRNINRFKNIWLPQISEYGLYYPGIIKAKGKKKNKYLIGANYFKEIKGQKCNLSSEEGCENENKHIYVRGYPLKKIPTCVEKNGEYETNLNEDVFGSTGIIGGIQEDIVNINFGDFTKSLVGLGPYSNSVKCMKATLPVGTRLSDTNMTTKGGKQGWWEETHCIPHEPTVKKKYGNKNYKIPFSKSKCKKSKKSKEEFQNNNKKYIKLNQYKYLFLFIVVLFLCLKINMCIYKRIFLLFLILVIFKSKTFKYKNIEKFENCSDKTKTKLKKRISNIQNRINRYTDRSTLISDKIEILEKKKDEIDSKFVNQNNINVEQNNTNDSINANIQNVNRENNNNRKKLWNANISKTRLMKQVKELKEEEKNKSDMNYEVNNEYQQLLNSSHLSYDWN